MKAKLFQIGKWEKVDSLPIEQAVTCARIQISLKGSCITEHEDSFSHTVREDVLLSAYPLALWFATNWWRILYEPRPSNGAAKAEWRISHEMPSANEGYIWPVLVFESVGPSIALTVPRRAGSKDDALRYLNTQTSPVYLWRNGLEASLREFINQTVSRLEAMNVKDTELAKLWVEVQDESRSPDDSIYRILEACLGYDPDEAPDSLVEQLLELKDLAGFDTILELAPSLYGSQCQPAIDLQVLVSSAFNSSGLFGKPSIPKLTEKPGLTALAAPWRQASMAASELRQKLSIGLGKLTTHTLCDLLGLQSGSPDVDESPFADLSVSLGIRRSDGNIRYFLRSPKRADEAVRQKSIRFQLARFVGDELFRESTSQGWLACTESRTWRQAFQRAFAAELLCPPDVILEKCQSLPTPLPAEVFEDVASEFEVSEMVVMNHMQNSQASPELSELLWRQLYDSHSEYPTISRP
jgi:hypothetical protein